MQGNVANRVVHSEEFYQLNKINENTDKEVYENFPLLQLCLKMFFTFMIY